MHWQSHFENSCKAHHITSLIDNKLRYAFHPLLFLSNAIQVMRCCWMKSFYKLSFTSWSPLNWLSVTSMTAFRSLIPIGLQCGFFLIIYLILLDHVHHSSHCVLDMMIVGHLRFLSSSETAHEIPLNQIILILLLSFWQEAWETGPSWSLRLKSALRSFVILEINDQRPFRFSLFFHSSVVFSWSSLAFLREIEVTLSVYLRILTTDLTSATNYPHTKDSIICQRRRGIRSRSVSRNCLLRRISLCNHLE